MIRLKKSKFTAHHLQTGRLGEDMACRYLWRKGFRILHRNWKCSQGEVDVIAEKDRIIYFVEVKTRIQKDENNEYEPLEAVSQEQHKHIRRAAGHYLRAYDSSDLEIRFRVITIQIFEKPEKSLISFHGED